MVAACVHEGPPHTGPAKVPDLHKFKIKGAEGKYAVSPLSETAAQRTEARRGSASAFTRLRDHRVTVLLPVSLAQEDVGRPEVAVDYPLAVHPVQPRCNLQKARWEWGGGGGRGRGGGVQELLSRNRSLQIDGERGLDDVVQREREVLGSRERR